MPLHVRRDPGIRVIPGLRRVPRALNGHGAPCNRPFQIQNQGRGFHQRRSPRWTLESQRHWMSPLIGINRNQFEKVLWSQQSRKATASMPVWKRSRAWPAEMIELPCPPMISRSQVVSLSSIADFASMHTHLTHPHCALFATPCQLRRTGPVHIRHGTREVNCRVVD